MTNDQVRVILAHIDGVATSIRHANVVTVDRLTRLEHNVSRMGTRVTRLEERDDADRKADSAEQSKRSVSRGQVIAFLTGITVAVVGQVTAALIHLS